MAAPDSIKKLVEEFERLKGGPPPDSFDEAQLGTSYLEPFWEALGWAVRDPREVVKEKRVHLRASTKHADYCFQLARKPQFIVEAKDYRKRLDDADFVFQTKRYGYNLPVDFGVLTNFAGFRLFDTGLQPVYENAARGLFKKFDLRYTDYEERWDELAAVFSREAVAAGALRELLPKARRTRNKEALDRKFFERLNEWRAELARNVAIRNRDLGVHDINEAVQRILDRAIFMRVIEDRGIEATELLLDALNRWKVEKEKDLYRYVVDKFRYLEPQYNGELFEKHFSEDLLVDDKPLRDFIESLYYPKCPYQFNVVGVEMLGTVYERFLGSEIRLTPTHRAVVEPKPEVRKAGGVYYTPRYIVDYIVENTVGELLKKCKTPAAAAKLKILDPACGSGSFLLGAFRRLIDWHEDFFTANPDKIGKGLAAACWRDADEGKYRLTARFKGQILVNNIFGVDIDPQACEVTRMSLYLKVLENVNAQFLMKTALLPPLDANIKCGNSLIGSDYWDFMRGGAGAKNAGAVGATAVGGPAVGAPPVGATGQSPLHYGIPEEERRRVNPFDWEVEFPGIMKAGGFDAVIGNPPWIQSKFLEKADKRYYESHYVSAAGQYDVFNAFIEKGEKVLAENGLFGFIIPSRILMNPDYIRLREFLSRNVLIEEIADVGEHIFESVEMPAMLLFYRKPSNKKSVLDNQCIVKTDVANLALGDFKSYSLPQKRFLEDEGYLFTIYQEEALHAVIRKVEDVSVRFGDIVRNARGVEIGKRSPLVKGNRERGFVPFLIGEDMGRYYIKGNHYLELGSKGVNYKDEALYKSEKIIIRKTGTGINATLDTEGYYVIQVIYIFKKKDGEYDNRYLLGLLNSKLVRRVYFAKFGEEKKQAFPHLRQTNVLSLPIKTMDFNNPADVARHDKMVALVEEMLALHKRLAAAKSDADKKRIQRAADATDRKIDALVYELYGLTDDEIEIVEGAV